MSDPSAFGFGQFVPGFDFLQNLSKSGSQAQPTPASGMPGMGNWVTPTLSIEDIDKRIQELKSVLFWLEQNTTALKATIQAMEVQKMTLTTLQSMNVSMADLAKAFTAKTPVEEAAAADSAATDSGAFPKTSFFTPKAPPEPVSEPEASVPSEPLSSTHASAHASTDKPTTATNSDAAKPAVDPMQWWGALTQQFQGIASAALKDVAGEAMKAGMAAKSATAAKAPRARKSTAGQTTTSKSRKPSAPARAKSAPRAAGAPATQKSMTTKFTPSARATSAQNTRKAAKTVAASARKTTKK